MHTESSDRRPGDFAMFALGFASVILTAAGIVTTTPGLAFTGGFLLFVAVLSFALRSAD